MKKYLRLRDKFYEIKIFATFDGKIFFQKFV